MLADGRGGRGWLDPISSWASFSTLFLGKKNDLTSSSSSSSSLSSCRSLSSLCAAATAWSNYRWFKMSSLRVAILKYWIPTSLSQSKVSNFLKKWSSSTHYKVNFFMLFSNISSCTALYQERAVFGKMKMDPAKRAQTQNAGEVSWLQWFFSQSVELMASTMPLIIEFFIKIKSQFWKFWGQTRIIILSLP